MAVALLTPLKAAPAGGTGTLALVKAFDDLHLAPGKVKAQDQVVEFGNLHLVLGSGVISQVTANGAPVGLYFRGDGTLTYKPQGPAGGLPVADTLKEAFLLFAGGEVPVLQGSPAGEPVTRLDALMEGFDGESLPFAGHLAALAIANGPAAHVKAGFLRGKSGRFFYLKRQDGETLSRVENEGGTLKPVVSQSATPAYALREVDLALNVPMRAPAQITAVETVVPAWPGQRILEFRLRSGFWAGSFHSPNAVSWEGDSYFRPRDPWAMSSWDSPIKLEKVETLDGRALAFDHRRGRVLVAFPEPLPAGVPVKIRFRIEDGSTKLQYRAANWSLGAIPWFPQGDGPGQSFAVHCLLETADPVVGRAPGRVLRDESGGSGWILETWVEAAGSFTCQGFVHSR
jgi:hypothetical protein